MNSNALYLTSYSTVNDFKETEKSYTTAECYDNATKITLLALSDRITKPIKESAALIEAVSVFESKFETAIFPLFPALIANSVARLKSTAVTRPFSPFP